MIDKTDITPSNLKQAFAQFIRFLKGELPDIKVSYLLELLEMLVENPEASHISTHFCSNSLRLLKNISDTLALYKSIYVNGRKLCESDKKYIASEKILGFISQFGEWNFSKIYEPDVLPWFGLKPVSVNQQLKLKINNSKHFSYGKVRFDNVCREQVKNTILGVDVESIKALFKSLGDSGTDANHALIYCERTIDGSYLIRFLSNRISGKNNNYINILFQEIDAKQNLNKDDLRIFSENAALTVINDIINDIEMLKKIDIKDDAKSDNINSNNNTNNNSNSDQIDIDKTLLNDIKKHLIEIIINPQNPKKIENDINHIFTLLKPVYKCKLEEYCKAKVRPHIMNISIALQVDPELIYDWLYCGQLQFGYLGFVGDVLPNMEGGEVIQEINEAIDLYSKDFLDRNISKSDDNKNKNRKKIKRKSGKEEVSEDTAIIVNSIPNAHRLTRITEKKLLHTYSVNVSSFVSSDNNVKSHNQNMPLAIIVVNILLSKDEKPKILEIFVYPLHPIATLILNKELIKEAVETNTTNNNINLATEKIRSLLNYGFKVAEFLNAVHSLIDSNDELLETYIPNEWIDIDYFISILSKITGILEVPELEANADICRFITKIYDKLIERKKLLNIEIQVIPEKCEAAVKNWLATTIEPGPPIAAPVVVPPQESVKMLWKKIAWGFGGFTLVAACIATCILFPILPIFLALISGVVPLTTLILAGLVVASMLGAGMMLRGAFNKSLLITALGSLGCMVAIIGLFVSPIIGLITSLLGVVPFVGNRLNKILLMPIFRPDSEISVPKTSEMLSAPNQLTNSAQMYKTLGGKAIVDTSKCSLEQKAGDNVPYFSPLSKKLTHDTEEESIGINFIART